ncbi:hypothetical protein SESBI_45148 [Sesbania bispinosa]|nr:hypothetical protein SESBI_45148 [Sesbania bispinosa]
MMLTSEFAIFGMVLGISKAATVPDLVTWKSNLSGSGEVALNVDGNPGPAGFGGVFHDGIGEWFYGFYGNIGVSEILQAELVAILHGGMVTRWFGVIFDCKFSKPIS